MKRAGFAVLLLCAAVLATEEPSQGQGRGEGGLRRARQPISNQYIVVLHAGEDPVQIGREMAGARGRVMRTYRRALNGFAAHLTPEAAARLAEDPRVRFVEEDRVISLAQIQGNAPASLDRIDQRMLPLDGAYEYDEVANFVRVHVIDSGIRASHQEFGGRAVIGGDYVDDDGDADPTDIDNDDGDPSSPDGADCNGHGTHVAGTIGGTTFGVAKNVALYSHRILNCNGVGALSGALAAIDAIVNDSYRPAVVNMSLGGEPSDALDAAVRGAIASGLSFVVAAGNSLSDASNFSPARVAEAVTVGATDVNDFRAFFSNFGASLDLFAPGVAVPSAWHTSDVDTMIVSGTSMSAPHVAGVAALYLSRDPNMTPAQVHDRLVSAATPNTVLNPGAGSPSRVLYSRLDHLSAPLVELAGPHANERLLSGRPYVISWEASDPDGLAGMDVLLSTDSGVSYTPLAGCAGLDATQRSCTWASPGPETTTARIRVLARDLTGDSAFDGSSGNFSIVSMADLVTLEVTHSPARVSPGSSITVTDRVRNVGNSDSIPATTRYYLSLDQEKGSGDKQLSGSRALPVLAPEGESAGTVALTVLTSIDPGTYYVLACADTSRQVKELDELNNCAGSSTQVVIEYANVTVTTVSNPPASAAPGGSFTASDTVKNTSQVTASNSSVRYYFSADASRDAADVMLNGARSVPDLEAGATSTGSRSVSIPSSVPTGTYRLLACADDTHIVDESNESDNCAAATGSVVVELPDLTTSSVGQEPPAAAPGSSITVTDTVQNLSTVTAGFTTTRYYLSADGQKSPDDLQLTSSRFISSLAGGAGSTGSRSVPIPSSTPQGTYRVIACADDKADVDESNETNNCAAAASTLVVSAPDLVTTAVTNPPATAAPGSAFTMTDTVQNAGLVAVGYTTTRYYLSTDVAKSLDDVAITTARTVLSLAPGATSTGSRTIIVPGTTPAGAYRVLACADDTLKIDESDESNNCRASGTHVTVALPDLVVSNISNPPLTVAPGGAFSVTETVQNIGMAASSGWARVRYYLSIDSTFDAGDLQLSSFRLVGALGPGASSTASRTLLMPTIPGSYHVIACADTDGDVGESDETNNCRVSATAVLIGSGQ